MSRRSDHIFSIGAGVLVCVAIAAGVATLGSPARQREYAADWKRIENLRAIAQTLHARYQQSPRQELPASLDAINNLQHTDPVTNKPYEYTTSTAAGYQLCAVFAHDSKTEDGHRRRYYYDHDFWSHPAGRHCYQLNAEKPAP